MWCPPHTYTRRTKNATYIAIWWPPHIIWWPPHFTQEEQRILPDNMWWPPDSDVVATTSLSGGHHILSGGHQIMWWPMATTSLSGGHHILTQEEQRIPHTSLSGGHQIICGGHQIMMWWPLHRYLVATTYYLVATR